MRKSLFGPASAVLAGLLLPAAATAEESGTFTALRSLVHDYATLSYAGGSVTAGTVEGTSTVLTSTGGPFAQGEHSLVKCVVYARYSVTEGYLEAPCVATDVSGDRLYMLALRTQGSVEPGTSGAGRFELRGGTGSYAGIRGDCNYETRYITSDRHVTMAECQWRKP